MGGGDGGLRHVVHKRVHLERHQPKSRRRLGYLEKHKDYVKRAKDFHKKEDIIKKLHRKAYFRNEDEFAYGMVSHFTTKDGKKQKKTHLSQEEEQLADSQDAQYVTMREQIDNRAVDKRTERLHFLDADKPNKHFVFVDEDDLGGGKSASSSSSAQQKKSKRLADFSVAEYFDTHPALLKRKANRLRLKQLETRQLSQPEPRAAKEAYHELLQLQERSKKLRNVREELELRTNLRKKGAAVQVAEGTKSAPAQYRWMYDRKR
mmetsp:Transcript_35987/g.66998  ORF Transcript_35987/g.66998 Transcript_35987/m.66998 type:complete len:262 (-) Transcript_35987:7-792(-)